MSSYLLIYGRPIFDPILIRLTYFTYNLTKLFAPDNFLITHDNLLLACLRVNKFGANLVPLCYQEVILCQGDNIFLLCYNKGLCFFSFNI